MIALAASCSLCLRVRPVDTTAQPTASTATKVGPRSETTPGAACNQCQVTNRTVGVIRGGAAEPNGSMRVADRAMWAGFCPAGVKCRPAGADTQGTVDPRQGAGSKSALRPTQDQPDLRNRNRTTPVCGCKAEQPRNR
jgi:hypothetical protein